MSNSSDDQIITCKVCGSQFVHSASDQAFYESKSYPPPRSCRACRQLRRARRPDDRVVAQR